MKTKICATLVALACVASIGSVSADEIAVADTAGETGPSFTLLDGIAPSQMSVQELADTRGAGSTSGDSALVSSFDIDVGDRSSSVKLLRFDGSVDF